MKTGIAAVVIALVVAGAGSVASATQCPGLIAQARAALAEFKRAPGVAAIKDAKIAAAEQNIRAAEGAHSAGEHDEAVKQAKEALKHLGK